MVSCILDHLWQTLLPHNALAISDHHDDDHHHHSHHCHHHNRTVKIYFIVLASILFRKLQCKNIGAISGRDGNGYPRAGWRKEHLMMLETGKGINMKDLSLGEGYSWSSLRKCNLARTWGGGALQGEAVTQWVGGHLYKSITPHQPLSRLFLIPLSDSFFPCAQTPWFGFYFILKSQQKKPLAWLGWGMK